MDSVSIVSVHIHTITPLTLWLAAFFLSCHATQLQQLLTRILFASLPQTFAIGPRSPEWRGAWKFAAAHLSISCGQPAEVSTSVSGAILPATVPRPPPFRLLRSAIRELFAKFGACQTAKCFPDRQGGGGERVKENWGCSMWKHWRSGIWGNSAPAVWLLCGFQGCQH